MDTVTENLPIAVVGAGFSGTLLAIHLARLGARVVLLDRDQAHLAKGLAYGTRRPEHLLNVRASNMSAFPDDPGHFQRWMGFAEGDQANRFAPRLAYGHYLRELLVKALGDAPDRIRVLPSEVVQADLSNDTPRGSPRLQLADGQTVWARAVVLALGNFSPALPRELYEVPRPLVSGDPWQGEFERFAGSDRDVLLVGAGLTAIDVALALDSAGHRGRILALSRRGLRPRAHEEANSAVPQVPRPAERGAKLLRHVRERAQHVGWRAAVDELRPHTQSLWRLHDHSAQRRFLRHLHPWWDVHRHRLAPAVAERVARLEQEGRLQFLAGKLVGARGESGEVDVAYRPRSQEGLAHLRVAHVFNCTGPQQDITQLASPLIGGLLAEGHIQPDVHRLGIDVDRLGRAIGRDGVARDDLLALGPLTKGEAWEIVAVPDIRGQAWSMARHLTADRAASLSVPSEMHMKMPSFRPPA